MCVWVNRREGRRKTMSTSPLWMLISPVSALSVRTRPPVPRTHSVLHPLSTPHSSNCGDLRVPIPLTTHLSPAHRAVCFLQECTSTLYVRCTLLSVLCLLLLRAREESEKRARASDKHYADNRPPSIIGFSVRNIMVHSVSFSYSFLR